MKKLLRDYSQLFVPKIPNLTTVKLKRARLQFAAKGISEFSSLIPHENGRKYYMVARRDHFGDDIVDNIIMDHHCPRLLSISVSALPPKILCIESEVLEMRGRILEIQKAVNDSRSFVSYHFVIVVALYRNNLLLTFILVLIFLIIQFAILMTVSMAQLPSRIASLVHSHFDALPARSKPNIFDDGSREWIPMTGIVAVKGGNTPEESLTCLAITSGAKCLPASQIPRCQGLVLHDCHAEILAIRAFNYWLLTECRGMLDNEVSNLESTTKPGLSSSSPFIQRRNMKDQQEISSGNWPPFEIQPDVKLYMYCTCAPCGDGSMELCMDSQEDATPWEVRREVRRNPGIQREGSLAEDEMLDGRAHFSLLGVVRRKPARTDAESTRSKSCSDKLALRQVSSLLSSQTSLLVAPTANAYLAGLILPEDEISRIACERAFGENGRMQDLKGRSWPEMSNGRHSQIGYQFRPFDVLSTPAEDVALLWQFAKPKASTPQNSKSEEESGDCQTVLPKKRRPGNTSAVWVAAPSYSHASLLLPGSIQLSTLCRSKTGLYETIINGVKQGNKAFSGGSKGASSLSRARLWSFLRETVDSEGYKKLVKDTHDHDQIVESTAAQERPEFLAKQQISEANSYEELKRARTNWANPLQFREEALRDAKKVLKGWVPNAGDEGWDLIVLDTPTNSSKKRKIGQGS